jgi:hypothetical protein
MARDQALDRSDYGRDANAWLAGVDRAWANPSVRRRFETMHDLRPLGETAYAQEADVQTGYASIYRELFALWASGLQFLSTTFSLILLLVAIPWQQSHLPILFADQHECVPHSCTHHILLQQCLSEYKFS